VYLQKSKFTALKAALRRAFYEFVCVIKEFTLVGSNQGNYFENETACSKRTLKTTVATQPYFRLLKANETNAELTCVDALD